MKKILLPLTAALMLAIPSTASAQDAAADQFAESLASSLKAAPVRSIDAKEYEARLLGGKRSGVVLSLYGSLAALNVLDIVSSRQAIRRGAVEANPLMKQAVGSNAMSFAIKAATTVTAIAAIERIGVKNKKTQIVTVLIANAVTAAAVAHNLRQARQK